MGMFVFVCTVNISTSVVMKMVVNAHIETEALLLSLLEITSMYMSTNFQVTNFVPPRTKSGPGIIIGHS